MNIKVTFPLIPTHNFRKKFLSHKLRCYTEISGPEKSCNTQVKNYDVFSRALIQLISCWHVSRLWRHSVNLMNDRQSVHDSQYKVVCWNVLGLWRLKHWKIRIADRQRGSNFSRRGKNQYTKRKTESYVFNGFGVGISRSWEWKSTTQRFATGRF